MLLISSPRFEDHITPPGHPESPERAHVFDAVAARWVQNGGRVVLPRHTTRTELERVHDPAYLDAIERTAGHAVMLDPDTFTSPDSEAAARLASGAAVQAAEHAVGTREPAFALVRPPGHHAERDRAMGFCFYNNAAVAAAAACASGLARVAVVDIDVHHGNGTQHIFYEDAKVLYMSTHQFPFYPGTGAATETGRSAGAGFTVNVPLEAGATDGDYVLVHDRLLLPILDQFGPQLTIVSAGYDAHERDPLASMRVTTAGYALMIRGVADLALRHGALMCITEGGYELTALASCLEASFEAIETSEKARLKPDTTDDAVRLKPDTTPDTVDLASTGRGERAIAAVRGAQSPFWRGL